MDFSKIESEPRLDADHPANRVPFPRRNTPKPPDVKIDDLQGCGRAARKLLPPGYLGARCIVQATSNHGLKQGMRLRLWFWLARPVTDGELGAWFTGYPVDQRLFDPVQAHFTAAPLFEDGDTDPLPTRIVIVEGDEMVAVPATLEAAAASITPYHGDGTADASMAPDALLTLINAMPNPSRYDNAWQVAGAIAGALPNHLDEARKAYLGWTDRWSGDEDDLNWAADQWAGAVAKKPTAGTRLVLDRALQFGADIRAYKLAEAQAEFTTEPRPTVDPNDDCRSPLNSDDELALAFAERHVGQLVHVSATGKWLTWVGYVWRPDTILTTYDLVRTLCRQRSSALKATGQDDDARQAAQVARNSTTAAVERMARSDSRLARAPEEFDADDWVLNTPGGVVDLRTGTMRQHRGGDMFLKATSVAPGGDCPIWLRFLRQAASGDDTVVSYLQRWAGYLLTGATQEHALLFIHGPGGNGKSVVINTLMQALGSYATTAMPDVFTVAKNDGHPTHIAALRDARMVAVTETEEGRPWAESRVKSLTGGDEVAARVMRGDVFTMAPKFKLVIAGNHKPKLRNVDAAMRRRLQLLPFTFVPRVPDQELPTKLGRELPGILRWMIDGCARWQEEGLAPPAVVREATGSYFEEQDLVGLWLADRCERNAGAREGSQALFNDYVQWCRARLQDAGDATQFSAAMALVFSKKRMNSGEVFFGVKMLPTAVENKPFDTYSQRECRVV